MPGVFNKRPTPWQAIKHIIVKLHYVQPLEGHITPWRSLSDAYTALVHSVAITCHIAQRTARLVSVILLRTVVRHPLGWPLNQELLCMLMFGIFQSRQVPSIRTFFSATGDLQQWVAVSKQQVQTGKCSSWWIRLPPEAVPKEPRATVNWVFLHGGGFVAGHALMYLGSYTYWLNKLAQQGIACSILSVEYPLAPEHPFPAAVEAAAGVIEWLVHDSRETVPYIVGGDSAGGNLALAALSLLRDQGRLTQPPLALTLLSPVVDISDSSVFSRGRDKVSSHIDINGYSNNSSSTDANAAANGMPATGPSATNGLTVRSSSRSRLQDVIQQDNQLHIRHRNGQRHQKHSDAVAGGRSGPFQLLRGLVTDFYQWTWAHVSKKGAAAVAAGGYFDYLPKSSISDDFHHYLHDPSLLTQPLMSPVYLQDFSGLSRKGMLVVAGGAELMRPDIAAFAAKVSAAGVAVEYHEEPFEPHCYLVLALPHLLRKGSILVDYIMRAATN